MWCRTVFNPYDTKDAAREKRGVQQQKKICRSQNKAVFLKERLFLRR